ncbi:glucokinase [Thiosulfativibrio zosterae]|uniref:Glucokinase n=1 Tax=Thiosulfativibrio zosterae TaxID=2675053 RepID=A0A6F8PMX4_9GAMM|nr:glucokinase [Thiosulfativibrio zosterae]BBP43445.1 glucokinase [Thiosulfativibrio zosterae]
MKQILAGDIGGTKTVLALYQVSDDGLKEVKKSMFASGQHEHFEDLLREFLGSATQIDMACFGIAGPIKEQRCITTNLPWTIDALEISQSLKIPKVHLLNDLEAAAYGILQLNQFHELNPSAIERAGHIGVIAAGTGLGQAVLFFDGKKHHAMPSEGGHCDFAPQSLQEDQLLVFLRERFKGHVSLERILSGDGFGHLYDFLKASGFAQVNPELEAKMQTGDRNALISQMGLEQSDPICTEALRLFCRIYGAEAGNLALKVLPLGGVYIAGGIAPKIRQALESGIFMEGFLDKGRMTRAIEQIPVRIVDDPEAPLLGAAYFAKVSLKD